MRKAKILVLFAALGGMILLGGCWSSKQFNELAFVMGIAVDESPENPKEYLVTGQIGKPVLLNGLGGSLAPGDGEEAYANYSESGVGLQIPMDRLSEKVERELYTGHNQMVVVGGDVARQGINTILDYFIRSSDGRFNIMLVIAEGSAREILDVRGELERLPVVYLESMIEAQNDMGRVLKADIRSFLSAVLMGTRAPTVPLVGVNEMADGKRELSIRGMAVFGGGSMCETLDAKQSQALLIAMNKAKNSTIEMENEEGYINTVINNSRAATVPVFGDGELRKMRVEIYLGCSIADTNVSFEPLSDEASADVEAQIQETVLMQLNETLAKTQNCGADVFGFGEKLQRFYPRMAAEALTDWNEFYRTLEVEFDIEIEILSSGSILHTIDLHKGQGRSETGG